MWENRPGGDVNVAQCPVTKTTHGFGVMQCASLYGDVELKNAT